MNIGREAATIASQAGMRRGARVGAGSAARMVSTATVMAGSLLALNDYLLPRP